MKEGDKVKLPWWVELLFVQIGLPDKWLRSLLKAQKNSKKFALENTKTIGYSILTITILLYLYPLIRQAKNYNSCIESTYAFASELKSTKFQSDMPAISIANHFCNGGEL